jgi:hypothetical protein
MPDTRTPWNRIRIQFRNSLKSRIRIRNRKFWIHNSAKNWKSFFSRFLAYENMNLMGARSYGKRPRVGQAGTPLFNTTLDAPSSKRQRTTSSHSQQPGPSADIAGIAGRIHWLGQKNCGIEKRRTKILNGFFCRIRIRVRKNRPSGYGSRSKLRPLTMVFFKKKHITSFFCFQAQQPAVTLKKIQAY